MLTSNLFKLVTSLISSGCRACCRWCVCVCQQTAGCRPFQSVCPSSRPCATTRRWLGMSALSTVRLRPLQQHRSVTPLPLVSRGAARVLPDVFSAAECQLILSLFSLRPVRFPEVVPVHQNQNRLPGDKRRLDSAGPAGRTHTSTQRKECLLMKLQCVYFSYGGFCVSGGSFAEQTDDAEGRELDHQPAQLLSVLH